MNHSTPRPRRASERIWLHRSQWRTVAALLLLLAAVVVSLALVAGFWWASRARQPVIVRRPAEPPVAPVATMSIRSRAPSVIEVYPGRIRHPNGPRVVVASPGGGVIEVAVRAGERVRAGQPLLRMEQPVPLPPPIVPRATNAETSHARLAGVRDRAEAARLRQRLEQLRSEIEQARLSAAAAERPAGDASRARALVQQAEAEVERARYSLSAAAQRRQRTDERYQSRLASRFQFHLARSGELVAQVKLRQAEERASEDQRSLGAALAAQDAGAAARAEDRAAHLGAEQRGLEARLARVSERVAGTRQQLPAPAARQQAGPAHPREVAVRAPRAGIVSTVWARPGETVPRGGPLLAITRPERPLLIAHVRRIVLPAFTPGARVPIRRSEGRTLTGRVTRVRPAPDGGGFVEVVLPPNLRWADGAALAPPLVSPPAPTLPAAALQRVNNETTVWMALRRPGKSGAWIAHRQRVRAAPAGRNRAAIVAGLRPGDRVIVAGAGSLREGQPVAPVEVGALQAGE